MQLALRSDSYGYDPGARASRPNTRIKAFIMAGMSLVGAGVIATNPAATNIATLERQVEERAIALTTDASAIVTEPITAAEQALSTTLTNLGALGSQIQTGTIPAVLAALTDPTVVTSLVDLISTNATNPVPALTAILGAGTTYGSTISTGLQGYVTGSQTVANQLPAVLQTVANDLAAGQFTNAFSALDVWALDGLETTGKPLFPLLAIPGEIAASIPDGQPLANLLNSIFVTGNAFGFAKAALAAPIGAAFEVTTIADSVEASLQAGDTAGAVATLAGAPINVANALINGYVPNFVVRDTFPGELTAGGFFQEFLVKLPQAIAAALSPAAAATVAASTAATATASMATTTASTTTATTTAAAVAATPAVDKVSTVVAKTTATAEKSTRISRTADTGTHTRSTADAKASDGTASAAGATDAGKKSDDANKGKHHAASGSAGSSGGSQAGRHAQHAHGGGSK